MDVEEHAPVGGSTEQSLPSERFHPLPSNWTALAAHTPNSILLETSRCDEENFRSYMFLLPAEILIARSLDDIPVVFQKIAAALARGNYVSGFLSYEAAAHFERIFQEPNLLSATAPLAWFGVFSSAFIFDHHTGLCEGARPFPPDAPKETFEISDIQLAISEDAYRAKIDTIHEFIREGDTYQINFTDKLRFQFAGSPLALFNELNERQRVSYAAYLNLPECQILSLSPELFFRVQDGRITTRPMKGTAPRGRTLDEDLEITAWLKADDKNRAENVMIVDMLRNDIGRICEFGSVKVDELFAVEKYETLFQMISTISGKLRQDVRPYDIFHAMFPCGSVTGAPKIRSMQIIHELERQPRGVYTGAIGFFAPSGEAVFNVAIRTIVSRDGIGEMGVGSGITIDSVAADEFDECLLKARFLTQPEPEFELFESLLWNGRFPFLAEHLNRMQSSASYFGFEFDRAAATESLVKAAQPLLRDQQFKVRLALSRSGALKVNCSTVSENSRGLVTISPHRTSSADRFLYHKTTRRALYAAEFERAIRNSFDDVLFLNERGEVTEGAISNVVAEIGGKLCTPPLSCGLLPGVYRAHLLATNPKATERVLTLDDLLHAEAVYICNAVRGMRKVEIENPQSAHATS